MTCPTRWRRRAVLAQRAWRRRVSRDCWVSTRPRSRDARARRPRLGRRLVAPSAASRRPCVRPWSPHAPYSVSPGLVPGDRRADARRAPLTVHLGESAEEVRVSARAARADARRCSRGSGVWNRGVARPPGCDPVEYLDRVGYLRAGLLAVHGVQLDDGELGRLRAADAVVVTCPRSNTGWAPACRRVAAFLCVGRQRGDRDRQPGASRIPEHVRRTGGDPANRAGVSAAKLLESATLSAPRPWVRGRASGRSRLGSGPRWSRSAYRPASADVEEYLVGGRAAEALARRDGNPVVRSERPDVGALPEQTPTRRSCAISHSVFALPFALTGALLARIASVPLAWPGASAGSSRAWSRPEARPWDSTVWSTRRYDARNPRTALREIAARRDVAGPRPRVFVAVAVRGCSSCVASQLGPLCLALSPVALAIVFWYSLAKRFTSYTQLFLGLAMAVAPVGGWLAAGGRGGVASRGCSVSPSARGSAASTCCMRARIWTSIAREGLRSIPVRFGVAARAGDLARHARRDRALPGGRWALTRAGLGRITRRRGRRGGAARLGAVAGPRARPVAGQAGVRPERVGGPAVSVATTAVSLVLPLTRTAARLRVAITGASGAIYAVRTIAALLERGLPPRDRSQRLRTPPAASTSWARAPRSTGSGDLLVSATAPAAGQGSFVVHSNKDLGAALASGSHECEAMVDRAVLDEDARRRGPRPVAQPRRAGRRRDAEGDSGGWCIVPRETPMSLPAAAQPGRLRRGRRHDSARHAGVLPEAADASTTSRTSSPARSSARWGLIRTCIRSGRAERARSADQRAGRLVGGEMRARGGIVIGICVAARTGIRDAGVERLGPPRAARAAVSRNEREHHAVAVRDVEEAHRVADFVDGDGARHFHAAAGTDILPERNLPGSRPTYARPHGVLTWARA